jgi:hypothetical protein
MQGHDKVIQLFREGSYEEARQALRAYVNDDQTRMYSEADIEKIIQDAKQKDGRLLNQQVKKGQNVRRNKISN